ncbi:MAG TPA: helix-turn-helix domain-containing protein [Pseudonocardiaceae bacterium]|nr:helix-turn-helix domain-containing protein [Pseudonocardiaceae bacterium]
MTAAVDDLEQHTLLPPEPGTPEQTVLRALGAFLTPEVKPTKHARLIGPEGDEIELPDELYTVIRAAVHTLLTGRGISIAPHTAVLSTQEAADLLGISRPTLVKLLEGGEIPFEQSGHRRHRRIRLADVEAYRQRARQSRRTALGQLTRDADEDNLYETGTGFINTR